METLEAPRVLPEIRIQAEAAFLALAAGDALGWPQEGSSAGSLKRRLAATSPEFRRWTRRHGGRFQPHEEGIQAGEYSDDTQLTLAVARCRAIQGSGWWNAWTRTELPLWILYQRGGGRATKSAAASWLRGVPPWKAKEPDAEKYFAAGGNGVAMRVLPHAIFHAGEADAVELTRDVARDGVATHGHPRALVGSAAFAYAAWWLLRARPPVGFGEVLEALLDDSPAWGQLPDMEHSKNGWLEAANRTFRGGYDPLWKAVVEEMRELLGRARKGLQAGALADDESVLASLGSFEEARGAGTVSAAAAIYLCARHAVQPVQGVLRVAFARGADTDTIAAMTGGLLGCLAGIDWLPAAWRNVQDADYLRQLARQVARGAKGTAERPSDLRMISARDLDGIVSALAGGREEVDLDGIRQARKAGSAHLKSLSPSIRVQAWRLQTSDGQTLYVKKIGRESSARARVGLTLPQQVHETPSPVAEPPATARVKLVVSDLARTSHFYEDALGLFGDASREGILSYGALCLADAALDRSVWGSEGATASKAGPGRARIQVFVPDLDAALQRVEAHGASIIRAITLPGLGRAFLCLDPEENWIEVIERRSS